MGSSLMREFSHIPDRVPLAITPTPLHPLYALRNLLGGEKSVPRLLIKRDDLNGFAFGGNKCRKLEWLLSDALSQGCDTLITAGAAQSNHCRQTAGAGAVLGLEVHLCLRGPEPSTETGNLILDDWLGAQKHFSPPGANVSDALLPLAEKLTAEGKRPYIIPIGGSNPVGTTGYAWAVKEIAAQDGGSDADYFVCAVGSGGTLAGLHVGTRWQNLKTRVLGVGVALPDTVSWNVDVAHLANETAAHLRLPFTFAPGDIECPMDFMGPRYGAPTPESQAAIQLLARTEGIFLDPVYSGKAFAALLAWIKAGRFAPSETVVFWHTGGTPALFAGGH